MRESGSARFHSESEIEESIVIEVPVKVAYDQWTQFEQFPRFMEGVRDVHQESERRLHWKAEIGGRAVEWDSEIVEQVPDQRIAWRDLGDRKGGGVVTFHHLSSNSCKVMVQIAYEPQNSLQQVGDALGLVRRRVRADLDRFRDFIEKRGEATGAYRESIA
ncbi:MAG: SRPBCC family protein [Myxococcota bacterium]